LALLRRRDDKIKVLADVSLFAGLSKKELGEIARLVTEVEYLPQDHLTHEGEMGREALVILAGKGSVRRGGRKIAEVSTGDVVGEMSLVTYRPRNATVRADTPITALVMSTREFSTLMDEHPQVGLKILRTVADRLAEVTGAD
jgi:CRP/FNR family transcriptional regulator, cyclic AMP receptor protein